jgi:hypothetical protein
MRTDRVEYNRLAFTRYPDSDRRHHRVYYWPTKTWRDRGVGALHVEVYRHEVGDIPDGWHVHHKDEDTLNNAASNLEALPAGEHSALHVAKDGGWGAFDVAHMDRMRELAKEWHASDAGREWHREHGRKSWEGREVVDARPCSGCGKPLRSRKAAAQREDIDHWCSTRCFMRVAERDKRYWHDAICPICGAEFKQRPGQAKPETCSRSCGAYLRSRRKASLEPSGGGSAGVSG